MPARDTSSDFQFNQQEFHISSYSSRIVFKSAEFVDFDLLNDNRTLLYTCKLLKQDTSFTRNAWTELFVFLFDHYLVMTKAKEDDSLTDYHVVARPVPLELLSLNNFTDPPKRKRSRTFPFSSRRKQSVEELEPLNPGGLSLDNSTESHLVYPCTIRYLGRQQAIHMLFTEDQDARMELKQKLEEAIGLRKAAQALNNRFGLKLLTTDTFYTAPASSNDTFPYTARFTCSVPFNTGDGRPHVAVGGADGVWIGLRHDIQSFRRVLPLKMVRQCAILEDFRLLLVLADRVLRAYDVDYLVRSSSEDIPAQNMRLASDVQFFRVGDQGGHTRIAYMKKQGLQDSIFRVLEPTVQKASQRIAPLSPTSTWFRLTREFYVPVESFDLGFLKEGFMILSTKGIDVVNFADFHQFRLPRREGLSEPLAKRCEACKPIAMLRVGSEFLLCYNEFGIYLNKHGEPIRGSSTVEWEGNAAHVAMYWPYILLFNPRFIEVRHASKGHLVQIIFGDEIRCIFDGRRRASATGGILGKEESLQIDSPHVVMSVPLEILPGTPLQARKSAVAHQVFEVFPTFALASNLTRS
ncbi:hypothetical protein PAXINDRAFT_96076 [Paxillus involutus ATCC 200175]|nr:hypothetical protein PAXINDRAFT_96076 [Paxillus involutus ATCC 200175]